MSSDTEDALFECIASALETDGYVVIAEGLPEAIRECLQLLEARAGEQFYAASVGRGGGAKP